MCNTDLWNNRYGSNEVNKGEIALFKNLIYFDSKKVSEYMAVLEGERKVKFKNARVTTDKSINTNFKVVSAGKNGSNELEGELQDNLILDCNEFENLLERKSKDSFFDFIKDENDYDVETIPRSSIMRFEGGFKIPEEFDVMDLINQYKPMLTSDMDLENPDKEEIFKTIFAKDNTKIPAFLNSESLENRVGFSKLGSNNLLYSLVDLEDFEDEDITIIAKVLSRKNAEKKSVVVFDVLKDLFSLGRGIRRQMGKENIEGLANIESDESVINMEVLAIYQ